MVLSISECEVGSLAYANRQLRAMESSMFYTDIVSEIDDIAVALEADTNDDSNENQQLAIAKQKKTWIDNFKRIFASIYNFFKNFLDKIFGTEMTVYSNAFETAKSGITSIMGDIVKLTNLVASTVSNTNDDNMNGLDTDISQFFDKIDGRITKLESDTRDKIDADSKSNSTKQISKSEFSDFIGSIKKTDSMISSILNKQVKDKTMYDVYKHSIQLVARLTSMTSRASNLFVKLTNSCKAKSAKNKQQQGAITTSAMAKTQPA